MQGRKTNKQQNFPNQGMISVAAFLLAFCLQLLRRFLPCLSTHTPCYQTVTIKWKLTIEKRASNCFLSWRCIIQFSCRTDTIWHEHCNSTHHLENIKRELFWKGNHFFFFLEYKKGIVSKPDVCVIFILRERIYNTYN